MENKKAAISVEMIVYVAIAVFVLVLVIGFATGAFQKLVPWFTPNDVKEAQDKCELACNDAKTDVSLSGVSTWEGSGYCKTTYPIDMGDEVVSLNCWDEEINEICTTHKTVAGAPWKCTSGDEAPEGTGGCGCKSTVEEA